MFQNHALLPERVFAAQGLTVTDPANGNILATVRSYDADAATAGIDAAEAARAEWAGRTARERAAVLRRWYDLLLDNQDELAAIMTAESGKPLAESRGEVAYGASFIEWFAEEGKRMYGDMIPSHAAGKRILVMRQPVGVCAAITPWNFPLAMLTRKAGPALAAGCPMLVKPAEATPLTALAVETLAHAAGIPRAIFQVLPTTDPNSLGQLFCRSERVRKLSFTGSTQVGRQLMRQSADNIKKLSLELGGNAPFIVFADADLDAAVEGAIASKFRNAGQTCVCANRFIVHTDVQSAFVDKLRARMQDLVVGDGRSEGVQVGPLINTAAVEKVEELIHSACAQGANLALGGQTRTGDGHFFEPTLLTDVQPDMRVSREEIFGPVVTVTTFDTVEEAINLANDTIYGLAAYFYSRDLATVWQVMEGLEYGMVGVNEGLISTEVAPFGGVKQSGLGREGSRYGLDEYTEMKYALVGGL